MDDKEKLNLLAFSIGKVSAKIHSSIELLESPINHQAEVLEILNFIVRELSDVCIKVFYQNEEDESSSRLLKLKDQMERSQFPYGKI